jgi:uncharacterized membrane protein (UPF0182 family)
MYLLILAALVGTGAWWMQRGLRSAHLPSIIAGAALTAVTAGFFAFLSFWGEALWFEALGYSDRFWTVLDAQCASMLGGAALAVAVAGSVTRAMNRRLLRRGAVLLAALGGGWLGWQSWAQALLYLNHVKTGIPDPVFGLDTGFFLFALPFYDRLYALLVFASLVALAAGALASIDWNGYPNPRLQEDPDRRRPPFQTLLIAAAALALVLGGGRILSAFKLLYSEWGIVHGPGWTDIHVRLPACFAMAALLLLAGLAPLSRRLQARLPRWPGGLTGLRAPALNTLAFVWITAGSLWVVLLGVAPWLVQSLVVEPNEITFEKPYIKRNIEFTLQGFHLDKVEERQFPASGQFTREMAHNNRDLLSEVRLWDWQALDAVYRQFQEFRLYYEFVDVDVDRYHVGGRYRQVMASARELDPGNLPAQSQTFVNKRFKYTHGYGLTLAAVSDFTEEGLPNLLVRDIPPKSTYPELRVDRPQIYYGELSRAPVVVDTSQLEFDYPSGEENKYIRYPGKGGVPMPDLWRKFLFGWKFDGTPFLFSSYPTAESRVMFHRQIRERVEQLAPFLVFDEDPYVVLADGRLYWIIDAYTTSTHYPYSEPFSSREIVEYRDDVPASGFTRRTANDLHGVNYVRNSVKAVVDAFDGTVDFYVFAPDDPLIQAWQKALPGVFRTKQEMPASLRAHVRYPQDFLLVQGLVYAKYHMRDPAVFYNQEDLWVRATEKHYDHVEPVEPYYVMWKQPGSDKVEFVLMQPFTPKNRQVLIGWIAGMCDGDNYGRFLAYNFPKERRVLGPQQVETKIDQDPFLSGQLTLWDQRGSKVIRGNVLAIPIEDTLLYVEPIYLRAETAAYPELRLVVVMHGDSMSYAETFDEALGRLLAKESAAPAAALPGESSLEELGRQTKEAFDAYLKALGEQRFDDSAKQLERLRDLLKRLAGGETAGRNTPGP